MPHALPFDTNTSVLEKVIAPKFRLTVSCDYQAGGCLSFQEKSGRQLAQAVHVAYFGRQLMQLGGAQQAPHMVCGSV